MKKSFVALAVLGAFAGTSMAADVTMYGVVDTGLLYQHGEASASIDGIGTPTPKSTPSAWNRARTPPPASASAARKTSATA